ncbi:MAG: hypothetical protein M3268_01860 [Acidobacteriota bacterium]|nr:hypothetical protein [Acidobacteriota bacterium]
MKAGITGASGRRSLRAALLLLLVLHAAHASAAHTHLAGNIAPAGVGATQAVSERNDAGTTNRAEDESQCLLCRLQRNLSATLYNSEPTLTQPRSEFIPAERADAAQGHSCFLRAPSGRAPPLR